MSVRVGGKKLVIEVLQHLKLLESNVVVVVDGVLVYCDRQGHGCLRLDQLT